MSTTWGAPAVVIKDFGCNLLDGNEVEFFTSSDHAVITQSNQGNYKLTCKVKSVSSDMGKAVHYNANNNPMRADTPCFIDVPPFPG